MVIDVLFDTDLASDIDDADALVYGLKSNDFNIRAVTTVYGRVDIRAKTAKKIIDAYTRNKPDVYIGEAIPIHSAYPFIWHTEREGESVLTKDEFEKPAERMGIKNNAVDFLVEEIMSNPGKYTLITLGALTNIARAIQKEPKIEKFLKHHYMMAGLLTFPDKFDPKTYKQTFDPRKHKSEHNVACDVEAAQIVFQSSTPKTVFPLDVTSQVPIKREDFDALKNGDLINRLYPKVLP